MNKIEKHPDADKLVICQVQVDEDGKEVQIVTGASNVKEGRQGSGRSGWRTCCKFTQGRRNRERHLRLKRENSAALSPFGMMCSIEELGSTRRICTRMLPKTGFIFSSDNR